MRDEVQRYRMTFKCNDCQRVFKKVTSNVNLQSAPCPDCKTKNKKLKLFKVGDGPIPSTEPTTPRAVPQVFPNTIYKCKACDRVTKIYEDVGETALTACPCCGTTVGLEGKAFACQPCYDRHKSRFPFRIEDYDDPAQLRGKFRDATRLAPSGVVLPKPALRGKILLPLLVERERAVVSVDRDRT